MEQEIESTRDSFDVVCPYCGAYHEDSWELGGPDTNDGYIECAMCYKEFGWERIISVEYVGRGI